MMTHIHFNDSRVTRVTESCFYSYALTSLLSFHLLLPRDSPPPLSRHWAVKLWTCLQPPTPSHLVALQYMQHVGEGRLGWGTMLYDKFSAT